MRSRPARLEESLWLPAQISDQGVEALHCSSAYRSFHYVCSSLSKGSELSQNNKFLAPCHNRYVAVLARIESKVPLAPRGIISGWNEFPIRPRHRHPCRRIPGVIFGGAYGTGAGICPIHQRARTDWGPARVGRGRLWLGLTMALSFELARLGETYEYRGFLRS